MIRGTNRVDFKVHLYARYRDDIIILAERGDGIQRFCKLLKDRAKQVWSILCTEVSSLSMPLLDFELFKDANFTASGQLAYRLFRKPTSHHVPLGKSSNHSKNIHKSWPMSEIGRIAGRSSSFFAFSKCS